MINLVFHTTALLNMRNTLVIGLWELEQSKLLFGLAKCTLCLFENMKIIYEWP